MQKIARELLTWFAVNRREMPWRAPLGGFVNPYHVFLSEMMLQQTTSATVHDYFLRFTARWPTLSALAAADREQVLHLWSGLGYYSRARYLHESAGRIMSEFDGRLPQDIKQLKSLRGVGDYTAAAIASLVYNQRIVAIDGNIRRVAARLFRVRQVIPDRDYAEKLLPLMPDDSDSPHPQTHNGDMVQALMELGSMVCRPKNPKCGECPLAYTCKGKEIAETLPVLPPKIIPKIQHCCAVLLYGRGGRILLHRRPAQGLLGGMVGVPLGRFHDGEPMFDSAGDSLAGDNFMRQYLPALPMRSLQWLDITPVHHQFTHIKLTTFLLRAEAVSRRHQLPQEYFWVKCSKINDYPLPKLMRKILAYV